MAVQPIFCKSCTAAAGYPVLAARCGVGERPVEIRCPVCGFDDAKPYYGVKCEFCYLIGIAKLHAKPKEWPIVD